MSIFASHPIELLRASLRVARFTWVANLILALAMVLVLARENRVASALVWFVLLAAAVLLRAEFCRRQARTAAPRVDLFCLLALAESGIWAIGLVTLTSATSYGAGLQLALSVAVVLGTIPTFALAGPVWLAYAAPLVCGQAALLVLHPLPLREIAAMVWIVTVAGALLATLGLRRFAGEMLRGRERAEGAAREQQRIGSEMLRGREQLRLALESIDAGVAEVDLTTGERTFSARYAELLGYREREPFLRSHRFSTALHPADRVRVLEARRHHLEQGAPFREDFRMQTAHGGWVWVQARGESVRDQAGRATRFVMSLVDITERLAAEQKLADSEQRYRALVEASPSLIWLCDPRGVITFVSDRACRTLYGYEPREMIGGHVSDFNAPEFSRREFLRRFAAALHGRPVYDVEVTHLARNGDPLYLTVSALPTVKGDGRIESVLGVCSDITALKRRERELKVSLRQQQIVYDAAGEGIVFVRNDCIDNTNRALGKMLGLARGRWRDGLIDRPVRDILARSEQWDMVREATLAAAQRGEAAIHEVLLRTPESNGQSVWCQLTSRLVDGDAAGESARADHRTDGRGESMILVLTDITALKRREELAWHQANHDELTGLPNRRLLVEHARRLLSVAMRQRRLAAVLVLDLDGFKEVNDIFGHAHGDHLLRRVALRLSTVLREYDVVARTGGDEFVALLPEIDQPADAIVVAEKMIAAASESLPHNGGSLRVAASVGLSLFPSDGNDFETLLARGDAAMYAAKAAGKNRLVLAADTINSSAEPPR